MSVSNTAPPLPPQPPVNGGVSGKSQLQMALELNSYRIMAAAQQLALCGKSPDQFEKFHGLCLSLSRGIDYGLAQNEVPAHASELPPVLKMVCSRQTEPRLQPAIMVLMISVKNACKLNWFSAQDTEDLLALVDEVASNFVTKKDLSSEVSNLMPTVSTIISRYYPHFKLGNVLSSIEVKPGYGTYLVDFHITKHTVIAKEEKIYLFVATKDNLDTSSCIVTPQEVNVLLNGHPVDRRNRAFMDSGPQLPTAVNNYLKYGINVLQVVGQFRGDYIFIVALMSYNPSSSDLPIPQDYEQPVSAATNSDSELIEGPSRVSLNCPISKIRIRTPVKGHICKHYQCFDFITFVEMNFKRPSWRCPSCKQSVSFVDLRVDQKMVKALQELGEKESEVIFSEDGSFKPASSNKHEDDLHDKALGNQLGSPELESGTMLDCTGNMFDLTGDDEMDVTQSEPVDIKPVINSKSQAQSLPSNVTLPALLGSNTGLNQFPLAQVSNSQSPQPLTVDFSDPSAQAQVGGMSGPLISNLGMVPVLTDAVSPALSQQPDNFQGINFPTSAMFPSNLSPTHLQMVQNALYSKGMNNMQHTRNVTRVSSAIQALPVQAPNTSPHMPNTRPQQHVRPTISVSAASAPSAPFQVPLGFNAQYSRPYGSSVERQPHLSQSNANSQFPNMALVSSQNRSLSPGAGLTTPHNSYLSQTLSQPPHMRSNLPRTHNSHGVGPRAGISNSTPNNHQPFTAVQLMNSQPSQMRPPHNAMSPQTQAAVRVPTSLPLSSGISVAPQVVSRMENLIDLQSEQAWRPTARMRGAVSGREYDALRSQLVSGSPSTQTPSPRPPAPLSRPGLDAMFARPGFEVQGQSANGTQVEGSRGML